MSYLSVLSSSSSSSLLLCADIKYELVIVLHQCVSVLCCVGLTMLCCIVM